MELSTLEELEAANRAQWLARCIERENLYEFWRTLDRFSERELKAIIHFMVVEEKAGDD